MGRWHAATASRLGARLVYVADTDLGRARELAERHGSMAVDGIESRPDPDEVDVVHVCAPLAAHVALCRAALARGAHVLVEKPLAASTAETEALYELADEKGRLLCPVHQFSHQRGVRRAMSRLTQIGRPTRVEFNFCSAGGERSNDEALDAIAADILPHPISILQALFPSAALNVAAWSHVRLSPGEWRCWSQIDTTSVTASISMGSRPTCAEMVLRGTQATIEVDLFHGYAISLDGRVSRLDKVGRPFARAAKILGAASHNLARRTLEREPAYPGLRALVSQFYAATMGLAPLPVSSAQAVLVAQHRDAMLATLSRNSRCERRDP